MILETDRLRYESLKIKHELCFMSIYSYKFVADDTCEVNTKCILKFYTYLK